MPVNFTVDAFPDDIFRGEVSQIRLNASMTQNVVIYTVVVTCRQSGSQTASVSDGRCEIRN